ncbi:hypothetical protein AgCh_000594 [Apium graveolens]
MDIGTPYLVTISSSHHSLIPEFEKRRVLRFNRRNIFASPCKTEVMLQDPLDDNDVPIVEEFQKRLSSANLNSQVQGDDEENSGPENNLDTSEENDFPFEFQALEVALEAVCSFLDTRTRELEVSAYPALAELKSKFMEFQRKTEMTRITFVTFKEAPGADIAMLLLPANWDDKEYIDDPNHVKPEVAMGNIFVYVLAQWMVNGEVMLLFLISIKHVFLCFIQLAWLDLF